MPHLQIETNVPAENIQDGAICNLISTVSEALSADPKYVSVSIRPNVIMGLGCPDYAEEPCAQVTLYSMGKTGAVENIIIAKKLTPVISRALGLQEDRFKITFVDKANHEVAWQGTTFAEHFRKCMENARPHFFSQTSVTIMNGFM